MSAISDKDGGYSERFNVLCVSKPAVPLSIYRYVGGVLAQVHDLSVYIISSNLRAVNTGIKLLRESDYNG